MSELVLRHVLILGVAWLIATLLRRRSAAWRHVVWTAALIALLILPLADRVGIALPVAPPPVPYLNGEIDPPLLLARTAIQATTPRPNVPPFPFFVALYAIGVAAIVLRWAAGWTLACRLVRRGVSLPPVEGVALRVVEGYGPLTFGWPRAMVVLPAPAFAGRDLILRHELAHVRRADFVWQAVAAATCALWWPSPLVWLAARAQRAEAEYACDDIVLGTGASASEYASCLLEVASMKHCRARSASPFLLTARGASLPRRIAAILCTHRDRRAPRSVAAAVLAAGTLTALVPAFPGASVADPPARPGTLANRRIVLDPGHGGEDRGALGTTSDRHSVEEQELNLILCQEIARQLVAEGARVTLTRSEDRAMALDARAARSRGQDVLISVHVGSADTQATPPLPLTAYFHGPRDAAPAPLARAVCAGLTRSLALTSATIAPDRSVSPAGFAILRQSASPALLIEIGNLKNPSDCDALSRSETRQKIGQGVVAGLRAAFPVL